MSISHFIETASYPEAAIVAAFPQFHGARVTLLDEGWDFRLYELDSGWLFRFPKRPESVLKLEVECKLLPALAERLSLPIPCYQWSSGLLGKPGPPFAGYRKLPGIQGDRASKVDRPALARQLGKFLHQLHSYPVVLARAAGVPEESDLVSRWGARALVQLPTLLNLQLDAAHLHRHLEQKQPQPFKGNPTLIHKDLWAEHILVDPASGRSTGIIDWGDVAIGDPAVDLAFLLTWFGEDWLRELLVYYGEGTDAFSMPRVRYLATCLVIHNIALGRELDRRAWIVAGQAALDLIHTQ